MKKILIVLTIIFMFSSVVLADVETEKTEGFIDNNTRMVQPCPVGGSHNMILLGTGYVYSSVGTPQNPLTPKLLKVGKLYNCTHCNLTMICQYYAGASDYPGKKLGWYVSKSENQPVYPGHPISLNEENPYAEIVTLKFNNDVTGVFDAQSGWYFTDN